MKIDAALLCQRIEEAGPLARRLEALGFDGAYTYEGAHDPFFPIVAAGLETERLELATAIAVAFARTPMLLANIGWDLQAFSKGRFLLGLGTQIRPHVEKRFGMPWSKPASRMREMVLAVKEIWRCWAEGGRLDFRGEFYRHTLMTPIFSPGPNPYGNPPIFLAGVGPRMTEVAGEVADGFLVHPLHTARSLRQLSLPALARGREWTARAAKDVSIACQIMVVTGRTDEELEAARAAARQQIAFYGSTPAYRVVLDAHGHGELQPELNALSKRGEWVAMGERISDEMLEEFAVVCEPQGVAKALAERFGGTIDRLLCTFSFAGDAERKAIFEQLRAA